MSCIRSIPGTPRLCKSQSITPIQFNTMSTMSELDRYLDELRQEDFEIMADQAYYKNEAMKELMDEPTPNDEQINDSTKPGLTN